MKHLHTCCVNLHAPASVLEPQVLCQQLLADVVEPLIVALKQLNIKYKLELRVEDKFEGWCQC